MPLENRGTFQIKSALTNNTIGRDYLEDRSFAPKSIIVQNRSGIDYGYTDWGIERHYDGYNLKTGGAATGLLDGDSSQRIVAILRERFGGKSRGWILRPAGGTGEKDTYHICDPGEGSKLAWTVEVDKNAPNGDRQIIVLAELDPESNSKQAFIFSKVIN